MKYTMKNATSAAKVTNRAVPKGFKSAHKVHGMTDKHLNDGHNSNGHWIAGAIEHPGAEKRAAKRAGMSTQAYMRAHEHDKGKAGRRARLGLTLTRMSRGK